MSNRLVYFCVLMALCASVCELSPISNNQNKSRNTNTTNISGENITTHENSTEQYRCKLKQLIMVFCSFSFANTLHFFRLKKTKFCCRCSSPLSPTVNTDITQSTAANQQRASVNKYTIIPKMNDVFNARIVRQISNSSRNRFAK